MRLTWPITLDYSRRQHFKTKMLDGVGHGNVFLWMMSGSFLNKKNREVSSY